MTEMELAELGSMYSSQGTSLVALWITLLSAYLVAAFLIGERLNSSQILILNCLYIGTATLAIYAAFGALNSQTFYVSLLKELNPASPQIANVWINRGIAVLLGMGTLASLKFMWDVRHPKTERPVKARS